MIVEFRLSEKRTNTWRSSGLKKVTDNFFPLETFTKNSLLFDEKNRRVEHYVYLLSTAAATTRDIL
jgi:hypothetical protein